MSEEQILTIEKERSRIFLSVVVDENLVHESVTLRRADEMHRYTEKIP